MNTYQDPLIQDYQVDYIHSGLRIDVFLASSIGISRSRIKDMIEKGLVILNGALCLKASILVKCQDFVSVLPGQRALPSTIQKPTHVVQYEVCYEDEHILIIDKPHGLCVHPGSGNNNNTLANILAEKYETLSSVNGLERPGIVHRIDKDTSGLMIIAKNNIAHTIIADQIKNKEIKRSYKAFVWGIPNMLFGTIDVNITRDRIKRTTMTTSSTHGKHAITHFKVLEIFKFASFIECTLETGRTHQIRVHMMHINHPIIGDPIYGNHKKKVKFFCHKIDNEKKQKISEFKRQALHSYSLTLAHPISKKQMTFCSEMPNDMLELYRIIKD